MSITSSMLMLVFLVVGGIVALNVISPTGNTIFEVSNVVSQMFSSTTSAFAEIDYSIQNLQFT